MEEHLVRVVELETGIERDLVIYEDEAEDTGDFLLETAVDGTKVSVADENTLPAFQKLRDQLLSYGYGIKCNGARINAVQSGMMGANNKMYLVELGRRTGRNDIVDIYDFTDISEFPDTAQQAEFAERWYATPFQ